MTHPDDLARSESLWDFAVSLYGRPGVSQACLYLQDTEGADVPILLFGVWVGVERRHALSGSEASRIAEAVGAWHREVVQPMRKVRRWLKMLPEPSVTPAKNLREAVKSAELFAERIELDMLAALAPPQGGCPDCRAAVRNNLNLFIGQAADLPLGPDTSGAIEQITAAACQGL